MTNLNIQKIIEIPESVQVTVEGKEVIVKGEKGELRKILPDYDIKVSQSGNEVTLGYKENTKKRKRTLHTSAAHIKNMAQGVTEGFEYKLKICSGHFPMNVSLKGDVLEVKNFIGESVPRKLKIKQGVEVKVNGDIIEVKGNDKELSGIVAGDIEKLTKRPGFDKRIFQDGIYIIEKPAKRLSE